MSKLKKKLDDRPARELTDREAAKIIGSFLGGLSCMASAQTIFNALDYLYGQRQALEIVLNLSFDAEVKAGRMIPDDAAKK